MPHLISIDSVSITNFGPFYGTNRLDLATPKDAPPHVLIGGKNGAGKTHILRAMYLAVVGRAGIGDLRRVESGSDATRFNFDRVLNRRAAREGVDTCSLSVVIRQQDADSIKEQTLTLHREIRFRTNSPPEWKSWAERSNDVEAVEDDQLIERLRDAFLPRHLARFFFFDAEKSQNVQLGEKDIVKGISQILGLWAYEKLEEDLRELFQTTNRNLTVTGANEAVEKQGEIGGKIKALKAAIKSNEQKQHTLIESQQEAEAELADIEDQLKTIGAVDPSKLEADRQKREEIANAKREVEQRLSAAWETPLPISLLSTMRSELVAQLESEDQKRAWLDRKSALEPKLPAIKSQVFDNPPSEFVLPKKTHGFYTSRLNDALQSLFNPPPDGLEDVEVILTDRPETNFSVRQWLTTRSPELAGLEEACRKLDLLEADVRDLDYEIRQQSQNIAAIGAGKELHEKRGELRSALKTMAKELEEHQIAHGQFEAQMTQLKTEEDRWSKAVTEASKGRDLASRAHQYREAASLMRKRASEQMRKKINELVSELWLEITDRAHEFRGLTFTGDLWQCELIRKNGVRIPWEDANPSAGQKQVRLLAFYEALRRLAQKVPPLVVDTPLGRLDREVRAAVLDKLYLSRDGHQSIVLATNAEIDPDGPLFGKIRDQFGRAYTLVPEGHADSDDYEVTIQKNYFGKRV
ncbi:hypothetical protein FEM03_12250 [Phragmitibacter flavus]|uniref:Rad50/SbcC-type AAA domain-containing protein n=1 Tax=Phragmitibacter flavus TaxID=2576071 RepID=A0A5R8KDX3_9BACT|nr:AAA family ATPase [Phragmitibacter flavus]TLD70490.1 hypothetical protein FEM03_12250 [Phragmitibacter flavus]